MIEPRKWKCGKCPDDPIRPGQGTGRIKHEKRQITVRAVDGAESKVDDPTDLQTEETCDRCGGSGTLTYDPATRVTQ